MKTLEPLSFFDVVRTLRRNWLRIGLVSFVTAVIAAAVTLFIPNQYKASTNLLPNQMRSIGGIELLADSEGLSGLASSLLGGKSQATDQFLILLNSYTVKKALIDEFDLIRVYDVADSKYPEIDALDELSDRSKFTPVEEGNFVIEVWDESPERAKAMVESYVRLLNEMNTEISTKEARQYRAFIEDRYLTSEQDLERYRRDLMDLQKTYGILELSEQVVANLELIGTLSAQMFEAQVSMKVLEGSLQEDNPIYREARLRYDAAAGMISELYANDNPDDLFLNFRQVPEIGFSYFDIMKNIEIETAIQKFVIPLLEQAKMEEAKSLPVVSIVDPAIVPSKKDYPKRAIITILAGLSALILSTVLTLLRTLLSKNEAFVKALD